VNKRDDATATDSHCSPRRQATHSVRPLSSRCFSTNHRYSSSAFSTPGGLAQWLCCVGLMLTLHPHLLFSDPTSLPWWLFVAGRSGSQACRMAGLVAGTRAHWARRDWRDWRDWHTDAHPSYPGEQKCEEGGRGGGRRGRGGRGDDEGGGRGGRTRGKDEC
jgi:hypothetical protein